MNKKYDPSKLKFRKKPSTAKLKKSVTMRPSKSAMSESTAHDESHASGQPILPIEQESVARDSPAKRRLPFDKTFNRIWRSLYFRFPNLLPSPYPDDRDYLLQRDAKDNLASQVPTGEKLRQIALWGVEIYGPAEVDGLHLAMERLGWNEEGLFGPNNNPNTWIYEQRTYGNEGELNLGVIRRPSKKTFLGRVRSAPLPESVDYAHGYVYQLSPSVTAVIVCFVLTDSASSAYHLELSLDRKTEHEPLKNGYRSCDVKHIKRNAIDLSRTKSRTYVIEWFATHLPGLFSCAQNGNQLPTAELITTTNQPLFADATTRGGAQPDWIRLLSPFGHREVWTLKEFDGLTLSWAESEGNLRYHGIFNLQTNRLTVDQLRYRGEPSDAAHISFADDYVRGILVNFAATAALREIIRLLRLTPSSLSAKTKSRSATVTCLEEIQLFFNRSVGIPAVTSELAAKSEKIRSYKWNCEEFQSVPWFPDDPTAEISETLRFRTHFLASRAQNLEKETREHLEQLSTILSTRENIRTQSRMELVAVVAAFLTLASLVVAIMSVERFATKINQQVEKIYKSK